MMEQLFFLEETTEEKLIKEVEKLKLQCERVRKGQFAKISELRKLYDETKHELEILKEAMCKIR